MDLLWWLCRDVALPLLFGLLDSVYRGSLYQSIVPEEAEMCLSTVKSNLRVAYLQLLGAKHVDGLFCSGKICFLLGGGVSSQASDLHHALCG